MIYRHRSGTHPDKKPRREAWSITDMAGSPTQYPELLAIGRLAGFEGRIELHIRTMAQ